ncbi:MAG: hypothetical protein Q4C71_04630 [Microbacteriaceae bacterium]|nr:hypothetical protein [Microbacteriaceae bacterium]
MVTTIKVSESTRDLLKRQAGELQLSLGDYLARLAEDGERARRFALLRQQIAATSEEDMRSYLAETHDWERIDGGA